MLLAEYALLCAVLAALSLALGLGVAWGVVTQLFEFDWLPGWGRIAAVLVAGIALVLALALGGSAAVLRTRPARVLREL